MFGLLRLGFWATLALLLLPIDRNGDASHVDLTSPVQAFLAMREVVSDMRSICIRKPDVCDRGRELMTTVGERAREGARVAYKAFDAQLGEPDRSIATGSISK